MTQEIKRLQEEHVLAEEEPMTAARTKQHEDENHTGIRTKKNEKRRSKATK